MDPSMILTALNQVGALAQVIVKKVEAADAVNLFTDRAQVFADLFVPEKHDDAYRRLYTDIQATCARKGITPAVYWYDNDKKEGAPCISIPIGNLIDLMDAATK